MKYLGISAGFHDAAVSVVDSSGSILFAGHSERYSKHKHDKELSIGLIADAISAVGEDQFEVHYYEKPWLKFLRQMRSGEKPAWSSVLAKNVIGKQFFPGVPIRTHSHHLSHAAAGFQTSPFDDATVVIIDAIGEFDTISIWDASYDHDTGKAEYKRIWTKRYPDSIGLFYSAMTQRVGLRPLDEEYILMGMAAYGDSRELYLDMHEELIDNGIDVSFTQNLHTGVPKTFLEGANEFDIAATAQEMVEHLIMNVLHKARAYGKSKNLVYGGGVALNCLSNRNISRYFDNVWIMPNPGDAGSSLGAALLGYKYKAQWDNAYLGHNIPGEYPCNDIISELLRSGIAGVASGRAEFGPRALGNRSLLADPRLPDIKDRVNEIKRRQQFRPFAPVILSEMADQYFDLTGEDNRYMQFVGVCKRPDLYPAIVHKDGTSRVQTVPDDGSGIRKLLEKWYLMTECPMLLNTSLNIRGEPMVNDREDADRFSKLYGVPVFS